MRGRSTCVILWARRSGLTLGLLYCMALALALAVPLSSSLYSEYVYNYEAQLASGPTGGFRFKAKAHLELLYSDPGDAGGQLFRLKLTEPAFFARASSPSAPQDEPNQKLLVNNKYNHLYSPDHHLYAHVVTLSNGTALIKQLYTHHSDAVTFRNIKKAILLNLLPTTSQHLGQQAPPTDNQVESHGAAAPGDLAHLDSNNLAQPELFSPDSISQVKIIAKVRKSPAFEATTTTTTSTSSLLQSAPAVFDSVAGYQNVTFKSRVLALASSNLTTSFHLKLVNELKSELHQTFDEAESISRALKLLDHSNYRLDTVNLERERKICTQRHCPHGLAQLVQDYKSSLRDESLAQVDAPIAFLRLLDKFRTSKGTNVNEILGLLKKMNRRDGSQNSLLDILAAVRTKDSILAALKFIKLPQNKDLNSGERFLSVLSVSAKTAAKMRLNRRIQTVYHSEPAAALKLGKEAREQMAEVASIEFITRELLHVLEKTPAKRWASQKLRWSTLLTLATLTSAYRQERNYQDTNDELNEQVSKLLLEELNACSDSETDCRVVALQAIGNVGYLSDAQFNALKHHVLDSGKRESISAMRVLRDLLQTQTKGKGFSQSFYGNLKDLLFRVVYDASQETTARVLSAEMIVRFIPDSLKASEELLQNLPFFGNNELATMIYSRLQSLSSNTLSRYHENWYWNSCIINGTSTSFVRTMARTDSLNASYGVNIELLDKGKILKESSFDVFLDTKERTQDLFSLGIFTRGMSGGVFGGGNSDDESQDSSESTTAGMTLRIMGGYLRPYVFFSSMTELMSHVWKGTAEEPTTAFNGGLLLIDHQEGYPLISGFVAEQQMRGVLSIDVTGKISVSIWFRKSNAVVRTKASVIVQASQSVFTSYDNLWSSDLFSFGGEALVDFVSDSSFQSTPIKLCLQVTQPEFFVRFNSRKHYQMMTKEVIRKLIRRNYSIGAKSYSLNTENNKMCSLMSNEL